MEVQCMTLAHCTLENSFAKSRHELANTSSLTSLPLELLLDILERVDLRDYKALILVSKRVYDGVYFTSFGQHYALLPHTTRQSCCFFTTSISTPIRCFGFSVSQQTSHLNGAVKTVIVPKSTSKDGKMWAAVKLEPDQRVQWVFMHFSERYSRPISLHSYYFDGVYCVRSRKKVDAPGSWRSVFDTNEGYVFAMEVRGKPGFLYSIEMQSNGAPILRRDI